MEKGIYLFKEEFWKELNIPKTQWERRKEDLLAWLENFFDYTLLEGRPLRIEIKEVIGEYQPLPRKAYNNKNREAIVAAAMNDYEAFTITALGTKFKPNSKAKIARDAIGEFGYTEYFHTNQKWVSENYIKPAFDIHAETNDHMVWVNYFTYEELDDDTLARWKDILNEEQMNTEQRANAFDRMMQGEDISKEKQYYKNALDRFKKEFGFIPVHVREWKCKDAEA